MTDYTIMGGFGIALLTYIALIVRDIRNQNIPQSPDGSKKEWRFG